MVELNIKTDIDGKKYLDLSDKKIYPDEKSRNEALKAYKEFLGQETLSITHVDSETGKQTFDFIEKKKLWKKLKYTTKESQTDKMYWEQYYSGCDVGVVIGSMWVDDVITIQYTLTNNKSPVYGYASENFDAVAKGTRIVQGQFAIAFKEIGYLSKILKDYKNKSMNKRVLLGRGGKYLRMEDDDPEAEDKNLLEPISDENLKTKFNQYAPDRFGYHDIYIGSGKQKSLLGTIINRDGFDIILSFGDVSERNRGGTVEVINNCHITSRSLVCEPTGEPIAEIYNFFARGLNEYIPKYKYIYSTEGVDTTEAEKSQEKKELKVDKSVEYIAPEEVYDELRKEMILVYTGEIANYLWEGLKIQNNEFKYITFTATENLRDIVGVQIFLEHNNLDSDKKKEDSESTDSSEGAITSGRTDWSSSNT